MEALFTPWRLAYLTAGGVSPADGCIFCALQKMDDADALVVSRGSLVYTVLNRYPYSNGHVMVAPYAHRATLSEMTAAERHELVDMAAAAEKILRHEYRPQGFNVGLNMGKSAGAGVEAHAHLHVVPRWEGDTNFLTVIGGTRTVPEELPATRCRLATAFARLP
jgi:ATP adenylyltransferase